LLYFTSPSHLSAYALALVLAMGFIARSPWALLEYGISAGGGFLQVLCTMTGAELSINRLAKRACLAGSNNIPGELKALEVRFGQVG
jgi:hypothetical protein